MNRRIRIYKDKELIKKLIGKLFQKIDFQVALYDVFMFQKSNILSQHEMFSLSKYNFRYIFSTS